MRLLAPLFVLALAVAGCGTSDRRAAPADAGADGGDDGGGGVLPRDGGFGARDGGGGALEGELCVSDGDCDAGLRCVVATNGVQVVGICGRPCEDATQCARTEQCSAYTSDPIDLHCVNVVSQPFATCGFGDTSICRGRVCLYYPNSSLGFCVDLCALSDGADAGVEDAGVVDAGTGSLALCTGTETCLDDIVASDTEGVCGTSVGPGESCGIEAGKFCGDGHVCAPDDPDDVDGPTTCHEDCTDDGRCDGGGTCTDVTAQLAYCL